jgi:Rieske Fe-S protein
MVNRRQMVSWTVRGVLAAITATLGTLAGGVVGSARTRRTRETWIVAADLERVPDIDPLELTIAIEREDAYLRSVERRVVFVTHDGTDVTALSAVCSHLGCRVSWDARGREFACPCHGGRYDLAGAVTAGPPPRPLERLPTRIEDGRVLVRLP